MYCRSCGSDRVRKLSLVYEYGVSLLDAFTTTAIGEAWTQGRQLSAIAARAAPPRRLKVLTPACFAALFTGLALHFPYCWIAVAIFTGIALYAARWNATIWRVQHAAWDRSYLCERCGTIAAPSAHGIHTIDSPITTIASSTTAEKFCDFCNASIPISANVCRSCHRSLTDAPRPLSP